MIVVSLVACLSIFVFGSGSDTVPATVTGSVTASPDLACVGKDITADCTVNATVPAYYQQEALISSNLKYSYDWGDFSNKDKASVTGSFASPGTYTIKVTVTVSGTAKYYPPVGTVQVSGSATFQVTVKVYDINELTITDEKDNANTKSDSDDSDDVPEDNILFICQDQNGTAQVKIDITWLQESLTREDVGKKLLWKIEKKGGGEAIGWDKTKGDASEEEISIAWTDSEDAERECEIRAGCDCNESGELDTSERKRLLYITIVKPDTLIISDTDNDQNKKEDSSDDDGTPGDKMLYVCQDAEGKADINIDLSWIPSGEGTEDAGDRFRWKIEKLGDGEAAGWDSTEGDFSENPITVTWTDSGEENPDREFQIRAWGDCNANEEYDEDEELGRLLHVTVGKLESLTVSDKENPDNSITANDENPEPEEILYVCEDSEGNAKIKLEAEFEPDDIGQHILWKILGDNANPSQGNFSGTSAEVTLTPSGWLWVDRTFEVQAGFDENMDGSLGDSEIKYTIQVVVIDLRSAVVSDFNNKKNKVTVTETSPEANLYICEPEEGNPAITIVANFSPNGAGEHILWKVEGATASPSASNFAEDDSVNVTLTLTGGNRAFVVKIGCDKNRNGTLETNEEKFTVNVTVMKLESLTVLDSENPDTNKVTANDENPHPEDIVFVCEDENGSAKIKISSEFKPDTAGEAILWEVSGRSAEPESGDFEESENEVTLTPSKFLGFVPWTKNREFVVKAGCDKDGNGKLSKGEVRYIIDVAVVELKEATVTYFYDTDNKVTVTEDESQGNLYIGNNNDDAVEKITISAEFAPVSAHEYIRWRVDGETADQVEGDFSSGTLPIVTLTVTDENREFKVLIGCDKNRNNVLDDGEEKFIVNVYIIKVDFDSADKEYEQVADTENKWNIVGIKGSAGDVVTLTITITPDTTDIRDIITWTGATVKQGNKLKATVPIHQSVKKNVTINIEENPCQELQVWPAWAVVGGFRGDNANGEELSEDNNPAITLPCGGKLGLPDVCAQGAHNNMELRATITPAGVSALDGVQFDFKRTVEKKLWFKNVGDPNWTIDAGNTLPAGTGDDTHNNDEDLHDNNDVIWAIDGPGLASDVALDDFLAVEFDFREPVHLILNGADNTVNPASGQECSEKFEWYSILNVKKNTTTGKWIRNLDRKNEIKQGAITIGNQPQ